MSATKTNRRPDPLAPFNDKIQPEYGLKIAEFISREWFNGGMIQSGTNFMKRRDWIIEQRFNDRG